MGSYCRRDENAAFGKRFRISIGLLVRLLGLSDFNCGSYFAERSMRIVIFGAGGQVGSLLVPCLIAAGCDLVLVGRNVTCLREKHPGQLCLELGSWSREAQGFDAAINLAVINTTSDECWAAFEAVNVGLAVQLAEQAAAANIPRFIQVSSVHALDRGNASKYARSKRLASETLARAKGIEVITLYLAAVWGGFWAGNLSFLNRLPGPLAHLLFGPMSAFKPTVHIDSVSRAMLTAVAGEGSDRQVVADDQDTNPWYRFSCVLRDYGFALSAVLLFWWALLIIWLWVRMDSPGPGIFAQERVGKGGKSFICYKFRTMRAGTVHAGTHEVSADAVTPVGAFLRRTKLDELPQIWNILKGDVRLVGPRPGLPVQNELFAARDARGVFSVKPGITGWAQIHDVDMSDPERLASWDAQYIGMRGILLDLRIILATAFGRGRGDRVAK